MIPDQVIAQLPAIQIVLPLMAAAICALVRHGTTCWLITVVVSLAMPVIAGLMLLQVIETGPISYELGSWEPPLGIEYRVDKTSGFVLLLVSAIGALVACYARRSVLAEVPADRIGWYYTMYLLCVAGLLGITITNDAFNIFVFMEISSLSSYVLIALGSQRRALVAAYRYLILGTIGATFIVIGIGLLFTMTGTLNLSDLATRIPEVEAQRPIVAALAFLTVGICLKLALFPLHLWLPNAYAYAPSVTTAFLAATATKVSVYLLLRFTYSVYDGQAVMAALPLDSVMLILSIAAMFVASTIAIFQDNLKRMLAYSSVAQIGYMTLGFAIATEIGVTAALLHLFNHALMKGALFMLVGGIALRYADSVRLSQIAGLGLRMPITMAGIVIAGLSMLGIPGTVGFVSKWVLAVGAIESGMIWLVVVIMASSLLTLIYVGRMIEVAYFRKPEGPAAQAREAPLEMLVPSLILVAACVIFGLDTEWTAGVASQAAIELMGGLR